MTTVYKPIEFAVDYLSERCEGTARSGAVDFEGDDALSLSGGQLYAHSESPVSDHRRAYGRALFCGHRRVNRERAGGTDRVFQKAT